jgi:hypothetical protein
VGRWWASVATCLGCGDWVGVQKRILMISFDFLNIIDFLVEVGVGFH